MIQKVIRFFQNVMSRPDSLQSASDSASEPFEDRRHHARHPSTATSLIVQTRGGEQRELNARARDVSRGGISLVLQTALAPGDMISVRIPSSLDSTTTAEVLACVVHVRQLSEDEWAVGCEFSDALGAEELLALGVQGNRHRTEKDQRDALRFVCNLNASYEVANQSPSVSQPAHVVNVSIKGIGLLTEQSIQTGTLLNLKLQNPNTKEERATLACVVHVTSQDEKNWRWGCNFLNELSPGDLKALL